MHGRTAVAGVGESRYYRRGAADETEFQLACIAIRNAVEDAGLKLSDVDGIVSFMDRDRNHPARLGAALGTGKLNFTGQAWGGGGNLGMSTLMIADGALTAGYAECVVIFRALAQGQFGRFGRAPAVARAAGEQAYLMPFGVAAPVVRNALMVRRYMHEHGIGQEALAEIALAAYAHAQHNPRAVRYGHPLTREDYHASRWIAEPFHLFDCCQENDGAAAIVMTTAERARDLAKPPVYLRAAAAGMERWGGVPAFNEPSFPNGRYWHIGEKLWERAGAGPADVDVAQFYENFSGTTLMAISDIGFAPADGIEDFVSGGNIQWPDGDLPINTSGGNLAEAYIHGFQAVNEGVRQVRGDSTCQVPDVELSLVVSGPGTPPGSAALFSREP